MRSDEEVVRRVREGETALCEMMMRRGDQRPYRVARLMRIAVCEAAARC